MDLLGDIYVVQLDSLQGKDSSIIGNIIMGPDCCWLSRCILALTVIIFMSTLVVFFIDVSTGTSRWCVFILWPKYLFYGWGLYGHFEFALYSHIGGFLICAWVLYLAIQNRDTFLF